MGWWITAQTPDTHNCWDLTAISTVYALTWGAEESCRKNTGWRIKDSVYQASQNKS